MHDFTMRDFLDLVALVTAVAGAWNAHVALERVRRLEQLTGNPLSPPSGTPESRPPPLP